MARIGIASGRLPINDLLELAKEADDRGYHSLWLTEGSGREAFTQIAALAMVTKRLQFGPGVVVAFGRSPTMLAMITATLDEISGQRFIQGVGSGGPGAGINHGATYEKPLNRVRDYVNIIKMALRGETVKYTGKAYSINGFKLGFTPPRPNPPVYIAALGPKMSQVGGEVADGLIYSLPTPHYIKQTVPIIKAAAEKAGRKFEDIDVVGYLLCDPNPDAEKGRASIREHILGYTRSAPYVNMLKLSGYSEEVDGAIKATAEGNRDKALAAISDRMVDDIGMAGDVKAWGKRIDQIREAGVTLPVLRPSNPISGSLEQLKLTLAAYRG